MPAHRVPEPFNERAVIDWTPVWSLVSGRQRLAPTALLYFDPDPSRGPVSILANSNGNAAGTTLEDAIVQGFLELVERDAVALWWYNRTRQPAVQLDSFGDPWLAGFPDLLARLGRQVWVLDVTSDLGIPVMAAVSRRTDKPAEDLMFGFGAHFDPRIAVRRALTELGQLLPAVTDARADGTGYRVSEPHLMSWWTTATGRNQPYLLPQPVEPRTAASYGYQPVQSIDLDPIRAIARRAGLDILVLDQTRPDIGMPVVKVLVPGLRHFWPRFAPGRLYDVPVQLGRLAEPTAYQDLNPTPLFVLRDRGSSPTEEIDHDNRSRLCHPKGTIRAVVAARGRAGQPGIRGRPGAAAQPVG
ncbi:MAG TPA: YcaO-like family protein, partial [Trebonia sp.]